MGYTAFAAEHSKLRSVQQCDLRVAVNRIFDSTIQTNESFWHVRHIPQLLTLHWMR